MCSSVVGTYEWPFDTGITTRYRGTELYLTNKSALQGQPFMSREKYCFHSSAHYYTLTYTDNLLPNLIYCVEI